MIIINIKVCHIYIPILYHYPNSNINYLIDILDKILPELIYEDSLICGDFYYNTIFDLNDIMEKYAYSHTINNIIYRIIPIRIIIDSKNTIDNIYIRCIVKSLEMECLSAALFYILAYFLILWKYHKKTNHIKNN